METPDGSERPGGQYRQRPRLAGTRAGVRASMPPGPATRPISVFTAASAGKLPAVESSPVFTDLSGRRHRLMRRLGIGVAVVLLSCLAAIVVAMAGGPQAPFT